MDFTQTINQVKEEYKLYIDDYYKNATIIFKLIYDNQVFDRYYETMYEFKNLESKLYSDKHISKLMLSSKKKELAINLLRSRALGCLAIVDSIDKLQFDNKGMTKTQILAFNALIEIKKSLIKLAKESIEQSNSQAELNDFKTYHFKGEENYFNQL